MATCSFCSRRGHTRRTCPALDKHIRDNPDGYEARKRQRELANKKPRKCSYCSEPGHTKRTCPTLKSDSLLKTVGCVMLNLVTHARIASFPNSLPYFLLMNRFRSAVETSDFFGICFLFVYIIIIAVLKL